MGKHALLSPSKADQWMTCPGSINLSDGLPNPTSEAAEEGTNYHTLAQLCLEQGKDAVEFVGMPFEDETVVTQENADDLQNYIDLVREVAAQGGLLVVEDRVPIAQLTGELDAEGTCDALIIREDELVVIDLKFGRGVPVSAIGNRQTRFYALGALQKHELWDLVKTVRIIICQPRIANGTSEETISIEELKLFRDEVAVVSRPIVAALKTKVQLPLAPSDKACRFCIAKGICPELKKVVETAMAEGFEDLTQPPPPTATLVEYDERAKEIGKRLLIADLAELFIKGARSLAESELLAGRAVDGFKLVRGRRGSRKWTDETEVEKLMKSWRMKKDDMYDMSLISPTTAEKRLKKSNPGRWAKLNGEAEEGKVAVSYISQPEGGLTIAPDNDPRPAAIIEKQMDGMEEDVADLF